MARKEELVVGIDIGTYAVKVCQLQKTGERYRLLAVGSAMVPSDSVEDGVLHEPEAVGKVIAGLLKNLKIKSRKVGISISGYSVIVKKINLKTMDDEDFAKYINSEAEQYIPFDVEDVYLDFQRLPAKELGSDRDDIILVAAKKEVINEYVNMLGALKLHTLLVDVDAFSLNNIWSIGSRMNTNTALIDIGASKMNINIVSEGISILSKDVGVGSEQLTNQIAVALDVDYGEAEKIKVGVVSAPGHEEKIHDIFTRICTQWVLEIKKTMDLYHANNPKRPIQNIVLSGGGAKVHGLPEFISQKTLLPTSLFDPFERLHIDEKKFDFEYLSSIGPEMAIAAGLAIRPAIL